MSDMDRRPLGGNGAGGIGFLLTLLLLGAGLYAGIKLAMPYYAYRDLQTAMRYRARISLYSGDRDFLELRRVIREKIDKHEIPLREDQVRIEFDPDKRTLAVSANYEVEVEFPGYTHRFHFSPFARVESRDVE